MKVPAGDGPVGYARLTRADGRAQRVEFYRGSGYLSGSSRRWRVPAGARQVRVFDGGGRLVRFE